MNNLESQIKKKLSIPAYFKQYINHEVDLVSTPKVCCPFHEEDTPSFSYSADKGTWRCFGSCKVGGDVIAMHQKNYKLRSRDEAVELLCSLLSIDRNTLDLSPPDIVINEKLVQYQTTYNKAVKRAKTIDDYLELDYIMSQHKMHSELIEDLEMFIQRKG